MGNFVKNLALVVATMATSFSGSLFSDNYGVQVGVGYRQDSLAWEIKDLGALNPRAKSDLHFKDLEIVLLTTKFKGLLGCFYNRTMFDYGWIVDGNLREELTISHRHDIEHFHHDGLSTEGRFSKAVAHNKVKSDSYVWDFNIAFGVPFDCGCDGFQIAPIIGFSYDRQNIKVHNREFVFANESHHFPRIHTGKDTRDSCKKSNSYRTSWWGPFFGFDFSYNSFNCWNVFGEFEVHVGRNERHRHSSIGVHYFDRYGRTKFFWGTTTRLGANYIICDCWYLEAALSYSYWTSDDHRDFVRLSSGTARVDIGYLF